MPAKGTKALTETQKARYMQQIAELYNQGYGVRIIAQKLKGIEKTTVHDLLKELAQEWRKEAKADFAKHRDRLLAKTRYQQQHAWKMFFKSCKNYTQDSKTENFSMQKVEKEVFDEYGDGGRAESSEKELKLTNVSEHHQKQVVHGNPKYLSIVSDCIEREARLLGVYDWVRMSALEEGGISGALEIRVNREIYIPGKGILNSNLVDPAAWSEMHQNLENQDAHNYSGND